MKERKTVAQVKKRGKNASALPNPMAQKHTFRHTPLRVALFQESAGPYSGWIAQCLDYNIVAQGDTVDAAQTNFVRTLEAHICMALDAGQEPLVSICIKQPEAAPKSSTKTTRTLAQSAQRWGSLQVAYGQLKESRPVNVFA